MTLLSDTHFLMLLELLSIQMELKIPQFLTLEYSVRLLDIGLWKQEIFHISFLIAFGGLYEILGLCIYMSFVIYIVFLKLQWPFPTL